MSNINDKKTNTNTGMNIRVDAQCYLRIKKIKADRRAKGIPMSAGAIIGELVSNASETK